jgi:hypothetical protein
MRLKVWILCIFLAACTGAHSQKLEIGAIEDGGCGLNDDGSMTQSGWLTNDLGRKEQCVLSLFEGDVGKLTPSPRIIVNGAQVQLFRDGHEQKVGKNKLTSSYISLDKTLRVKLTSWLAHDSCAAPEMDGKCCGQQYEGVVEVTTRRARKKVKVHQWHGM